jgi:hypothetical protein
MTRAQVMDEIIARLRRELGNLSSQWFFPPEAVSNTIKVAQKAIEVLDGEGKMYVLGDGGPHGSSDKAWEAWMELAESTSETIEMANKYGRQYDLTSWVRRMFEATVDASQTFTSSITRTTNSVTMLLMTFVVAYLLLSRNK